MKRKRFITEINVVPYIDVMLVLLVIFMITTPMLVGGISVQLPELTEKASLSKDHGVVVSIDFKGRYYFDQAPNPNQSLILEDLVKYCKKFSKSTILIKADRRLRYDDVIKLLDILQQHGFKSIGLVTN